MTSIYPVLHGIYTGSFSADRLAFQLLLRRRRRDATRCARVGDYEISSLQIERTTNGGRPIVLLAPVPIPQSDTFPVLSFRVVGRPPRFSIFIYFLLPFISRCKVYAPVCTVKCTASAEYTPRRADAIFEKCG